MPALSGGMILYKSRSAKSVACSRLNVIGVNAFFFLPVLVAALTRADEFHSVTNTRWPSALSHLASSPSCVVFPEPSMPSTTNSLPGYSCDVVRLFNIGVPADFDEKGFSDQSFEGCRVAPGGPELELGVSRRANLQEPILTAIAQIDRRNRLGVAAVEAFGEPQDRGKRADSRAQLAPHFAESFVAALGRRVAVVPRHERDRLDLLGLEATQVAILD